MTATFRLRAIRHARSNITASSTGRTSGRLLRKGLAVVGAIGFLWLAAWGIQAFAKDMPQARRASSRFVELLKVGDLDPAIVEEAYALTCSEFRAEHSFETFRVFADSLRPALRGSSQERTSTRVTSTPAGKSAEVKYLIRDSSQARTCTVGLISEDDAWKVHSIVVGPAE